jgi:oxygen-independent coproporphyrinogen-3 oxidase
VSCYALKVEPGTPLYDYKDLCNIPDDDVQADMYLSAVNILRSKGFRQYEISNFARKGLVSRHNMKYWLGGEYLGFGPDAASDFAGKRFKIVRSLSKYIEGIKKGEQVLQEVEEIPLRERAGDYLMTRLRTTAGISPDEYEKQYLLPFAPLAEAMDKLRQRNLAARSPEGRWHLTPQGMLLSNTIITDLQIIQDESTPLAKRR